MVLNDTYYTDIAHIGDLLKSASGDLSKLSGLDNLRNALMHRLITVPGTLIHRPSYGVGIQLHQNKLNRLHEQQVIARKIQEQYELDPRVEQVLGVIITYNAEDPSETTIKVRVKPIGQDSVVMTFIPFGDA